MRFRWSWWRFRGVLGGALTGVRCVWKVAVEAFLGCCGIWMCVLGAFGLLWGCLEGDVGGVWMVVMDGFLWCWGVLMCVLGLGAFGRCFGGV